MFMHIRIYIYIYVSICMYKMYVCMYVYIYILIAQQRIDTSEVIVDFQGPSPWENTLLRFPVCDLLPRSSARAALASASSPWGNTNRVVSNWVVSKGPLCPSKTKINVFLFFDTTPSDRSDFFLYFSYTQILVVYYSFLCLSFLSLCFVFLFINVFRISFFISF